MTDLIDTTEMYLRTILELEEEGIVPLRARISERLGHSGPTVSQTVGRMERDGLVNVTEDRRLALTAEGRTKAVQVMRKHRLSERLLADIIGLDWELVHDEACRWEHVMSETVERRLVEILEHPTTSPYGNPIPGLEELGVKPPRAFHQNIIDVVTLLERNMYSESIAVVKSLGETVQVDPAVLREFKAAGLLPGVRASFRQDGKQIVARDLRGDIELELTRDLAAAVFVVEM